VTVLITGSRGKYKDRQLGHLSSPPALAELVCGSRLLSDQMSSHSGYLYCLLGVRIVHTRTLLAYITLYTPHVLQRYPMHRNAAPRDAVQKR
jgi:hypothetical protein